LATTVEGLEEDDAVDCPAYSRCALPAEHSTSIDGQGFASENG
jgi:hypothetical protein